MSSYAEVLGHRIVLDGTIGEVLHQLREARGKTRDWQRHQLRLSQAEFRCLENRPTPAAATFATDTLAIARACNVSEPQLLLKMLHEGMQLPGGSLSGDEASRVVGG